MKNRIKDQLPEEVFVEVDTKLKEISQLLAPYLVALSPKERMKLPKMGNSTIPFVQKSLEYTLSEPEFVPPFMNPELFITDLKTYEQLKLLLRQVQQLGSGLDDSAMQAGVESYQYALSYYNSVKQAAKIGVINAEPIYNDLRKRFRQGSSGHRNRETE